MQEPRSSQEPMRNQERRKSSTNKDQVFLESLASQVSQGIARGCEALLPKLATAPPAPLPQLTPAPQPHLAPAPQASFASNQVWRGQQLLPDGTVVVMRQGQPIVLGDGAGPDRLNGWRQ